MEPDDMDEVADLTPKLLFGLETVRPVSDKNVRFSGSVGFGQKLAGMFETDSPYRITPYLKKLSDALYEAHEIILQKQDERKELVDERRRNIDFNLGDKVLVRTHTESFSEKNYCSKFATKHDGPYIIPKIVAPNSTIGEHPEALGKFHASDNFPSHFSEDSIQHIPADPKRKRGRPKYNGRS
ncbi:hypothetical protein JTB14_012678 [Gonioctena quinquepunctata]|nr:hypothetical protein JTB14_012678 [Gonioctena quinquepunctata]